MCMPGCREAVSRALSRRGFFGGIAATAFAARDLDYDLLIVSDACTSPEQDNHAQFMNRIFPRMARIRTTAEVLPLFGKAG